MECAGGFDWRESCGGGEVEEGGGLGEDSEDAAGIAFGVSALRGIYLRELARRAARVYGRHFFWNWKRKFGAEHG